MKKYDRILALAAASILAIGLYALKPGVLDKSALQVEDLKFAMRDALGFSPEGEKGIVIVTVDEKSVNRLGRWPWDRRLIAELLSRLSEADLVGLDIVFSEETEKAADKALSEAVIDLDNVVAGFFFRNKATERTSPEALERLHEFAYFNVEMHDSTAGIKDFPYVELNIPAVGDAALSAASFNMEPDPDGLYRRYPLAYIHEGYVFPPLAVQLMRYHLNRDAHIILDDRGVVNFDIGGVSISRENYFRLNFYPFDSSQYLSASDVLDGSIPGDFFKGKLVLVGVTEIGVFDMRPTPVDPVTPGVWLHYIALSNLLHNEMLHNSSLADGLMIVVVLLLTFVASRRSGLRIRIILYALVFTGTIATALVMLIVQGVWIREFYALFPAIFIVSGLEGIAFVRTEMRAGELKRAFTSYVSPEVVGEILKDPEKLELGGVEREITILFSDIRGFTSLSESVTPGQLVRMLTGIHDPMTQVVINNRGLLDKYIGDAMMALFNAPLDVVDHPDRAVRSALDIVGALSEINRRFAAEGLPNIDVGVGVNTGRCIVGNMGSKARFEYTAIGDAVNLASRLEGLCKTYRTRIVISEFTREKISGDFVIRMLDRVRVKGKQEPVSIFEVMEDTSENRRIRDRFAEALDRYLTADFKGALDLFSGLSTEDDAVAGIFVERCSEYITLPPPEGWDGVHTMKSK